jgi:mannitol/fructose-specific phosphotransferase system IIA component
MKFTAEELAAIELLKQRVRRDRLAAIAEREKQFYAIHGQKKGRPHGTTSNVSKVSDSNPVV